MAKRRTEEMEADRAELSGILDTLPSTRSLEHRLRQLVEEAARVESLLNCVRSLRGEDGGTLPLDRQMVSHLEELSEIA